MTRLPRLTHWKYYVFVIKAFSISVIVSDFDIRISSFDRRPEFSVKH